MNAAEIVIREVQGDSGFQVGELLAEGICEPRQPANLHSHSEVLAFYEAGRNMLGVGITRTHLG